MKLFYILKTLFFGLFISLMMSCQENPKEDNTITVSGDITEDSFWTSNHNYVLDQQVTITPGVTLTIEPGTVIKASAGEAPLVSLLVVARGGKLMAQGTAEKPIIFTSINDNLDSAKGVKSSLNNTDIGLWGGIIILGDSHISLENGDDQTFYIGLDPANNNSYYGGENKEDNSGVLEYVSIRHGGVFIGTGSESNGLTLCGVGAKTTLNQIEIFANQDDGIEFFGGTVNVSNLIVHGSTDDAIDIDEGYAGTISNFLIQLVEDSDNAIEINGGQEGQAGDFTLNNGIIDGMGLVSAAIYSIDEKAKGKIANVKTINLAEQTSDNKSINVNIEPSTEKANEMNFSWTRSKEE
jgi:hypothetical protein